MTVRFANPHLVFAFIAFSIFALVSSLPAVAEEEAASQPTSQPASKFKIESPAFKEGESIPSVHTCDGKDISPKFTWEGAPEGTQSYALIFDDPKTQIGVWVHWVIYNIPGDAKGLPEAIDRDKEVLKNGTTQGKSSWRKIGFRGSCPPDGEHEYHFKLYALDSKLDLAPGATKKELLKGMEGHTLGKTVLTGRYEKQK